MQRQDTMLNGAMGGVVAGAVVALWFFLLDFVTGQPLHTPAALAGVVFDVEAAPTARLVATYTVLHFGVFTVLGIAAAWFLEAFDVAPGLLVGAVFGLGVLDAVHYGALLVTGAEVLGVLPGGHVLAANVAGGLAMMAYLHWVTASDSPLGAGMLRGRPLLAQGVITGLIGAGAVALWFLVLDVMTGRPFYTPAALGSLVFLGAGGPQEVEIGTGMVASYTLLHLAVFTAIGLALAWTAEKVERAPELWLMTLMALLILEGLFFGVLMGLGDWVLGALSWWSVGLGNLVAIAAMGGWIWSRRPELRQKLSHLPAGTRI